MPISRKIRGGEGYKPTTYLKEQAGEFCVHFDSPTSAVNYVQSSAVSSGGDLDARAKPRPSMTFANAVTEQTVSGVGREAGATDSLMRPVRNAG
jgi:hypothetical protein